MKTDLISRRSFLLGLAACSAAGVLTACKGSDAPASSASAAPEAPASSVSEVPPVSLFAVEDFPKLDGSTACIPLMAQMMADTTGIDLEAAQSAISVSTTAYAWESFGLYPDEEYTARMLVVYEAPDYVKEELKEANAQLEQKPIGRDALVFIVNENNPVKSLTRQQLKDIYAGKITNWKQVGGDDRKIVVYSRETSSGTYEFFKENLLKNKNYMAGSLSMPATGAIIQSVSQTKGAIGYVGLAYVSPRTKTLSVSYDGSHYAAPTVENATNKTYPIVRPLYYYYNVKNKEQVAPLINFILSPEGQEIIKKSGYIPVK